MSTKVKTKCLQCDDYKSGRIDSYVCMNECPFEHGRDA